MEIISHCDNDLVWMTLSPCMVVLGYADTNVSSPLSPAKGINNFSITSHGDLAILWRHLWRCVMLRIGDVTYNLECWSRATNLSRDITSRGDLELTF